MSYDCDHIDTSRRFLGFNYTFKRLNTILLNFIMDENASACGPTIVAWLMASFENFHFSILDQVVI